ncbi:hypothetical protein RN001_004265 [Aquatica leii]|uniref:Myb/SANT-like DNA-binding domain-containing protein n=1 Tax=Aquatica leii TaxID=1421715 RepID=A0AAN7PE81_9COLE|nr:hypothetical protein RN001_004265 [Aquatica leii]
MLECYFKKIKDAGHKIPAVKCSTKFQCLKRTYKSVSDHNKKSGNNRKHWEYYEIMHKVFGTKPWMEPLVTAGSSVGIGHSKTKKNTKLEMSQRSHQNKDDEQLRKLLQIITNSDRKPKN